MVLTPKGKKLFRLHCDHEETEDTDVRAEATWSKNVLSIESGFPFMSWLSSGFSTVQIFIVPSSEPVQNLKFLVAFNLAKNFLLFVTRLS